MGNDPQKSNTKHLQTKNPKITEIKYKNRLPRPSPKRRDKLPNKKQKLHSPSDFSDLFPSEIAVHGKTPGSPRHPSTRHPRPAYPSVHPRRALLFSIVEPRNQCITPAKAMMNIASALWEWCIFCRSLNFGAPKGGCFHQGLLTCSFCHLDFVKEFLHFGRKNSAKIG